LWEICPKSRKIREQGIEYMRDIGHNRASRSENIQKQAIAEKIQEAYHFNDEKNGYKEENSGKYVQNQGRSGNKR